MNQELELELTFLAKSYQKRLKLQSRRELLIFIFRIYRSIRI